MVPPRGNEPRPPARQAGIPTTKLPRLAVMLNYRHCTFTVSKAVYKSVAPPIGFCLVMKLVVGLTTMVNSHRNALPRNVSYKGTAIEFWKVTKAMDVSIDPSRFPYIKFSDRCALLVSRSLDTTLALMRKLVFACHSGWRVASYDVNNTKKHDEDAMRYLSYALYPLVGGYAIYALLYKSHKSWYSWIVSSLVGAVYMFGFILMCPQAYHAVSCLIILPELSVCISRQSCCLMPHHTPAVNTVSKRHTVPVPVSASSLNRKSILSRLHRWVDFQVVASLAAAYAVGSCLPPCWLMPVAAAFALT
eukprot:1151341-Pelagomonas_calceolata.AAC.2